MTLSKAAEISMHKNEIMDYGDMMEGKLELTAGSAFHPGQGS